jgi:hypothetical protein
MLRGFTVVTTLARLLTAVVRRKLIGFPWLSKTFVMFCKISRLE